MNLAYVRSLRCTVSVSLHCLFCSTSQPQPWPPTAAAMASIYPNIPQQRNSWTSALNSSTKSRTCSSLPSPSHPSTLLTSQHSRRRPRSPPKRHLRPHLPLPQDLHLPNPPRHQERRRLVRYHPCRRVVLSPLQNRRPQRIDPLLQHHDRVHGLFLHASVSV
jgi:hypothetical protein